MNESPGPGPEGPGAPWVERAVSALQRRAVWVVSAALFGTALCALVASRLELRTSFAELLPSNDPGVVELHRQEQRVGALESLVVAIESPSREANLRYAEAVSKRMRALPPSLVEIVRYEARAERAFFKQRKWLYVALSDLEGLRTWLEQEIDKKKNPLYVPLEEGLSPDQLEHRVKAEHPGAETDLPDGYFMTQDGTFVAVIAVPPGGLFGGAGDALYRAAQRIVAGLPPAQFHPAMQVGLSGDIVSQVEERHALETDLAGVTALVLVLVCTVVYLFYGRLRALPLMAAPALCGAVCAFAIARLAFGYLNSSTAFLGSIIVGNGINYAIIQLARYEEERRHGASAARAGQIAVAGTLRATAIAACAASISYGSLMLTGFRGFSQFGLIGGVGMILGWGVTVTVLPAALFLLDRNRAPRVRRRSAPGLRLAAPLGRLSTRHPVTLLLIGSAATAAAIAILPHYLRDPFEYNFHNLRTVHSTGRAFHQRIDEIFGRTLSPSMLLVPSVQDAVPAAQAIRHKDQTLPPPLVLSSTLTVFDLVPGSLVEQSQKLAVLRDIRHLMHDRLFDLLDPDERRKALEWEPQTEHLAPITFADLPPLVLRPFRERDGTVGRIVLVYPRAIGFSVWNGHDLIRMASVLDEVQLPDGRVVRSSGHAIIFAGMLRAIIRDAPIATTASFLGVALLVLLLARSGMLAVLATLLLGVLWMVGAAAAANERVNFLNFIALPITFGIGVDYGVNIYLRYRQEGRGRVARAVEGTGGAVALCSATTIIGYGALLVAQNRALRSFGALAILGEIATLAAALLILPAYLAWRDQPSAPQPLDRKRPAPSGTA